MVSGKNHHPKTTLKPEMFTPIWNGKLPIFHPPPFFGVQKISRWWFQILCFILTPNWGRFPFWRAYFSDGLKPPTRYEFSLTYGDFIPPTPCNDVASKKTKRSQLTWMVVFESLMLARCGWLLRQWVGHPQIRFTIPIGFPLIPCELQGV